MTQKLKKKLKNNYYRRKKMARSDNEKTRDEHQTNLLSGIFTELQKLNKNIGELVKINSTKKGK